jgi:lysylphosphatidylglycerol synthetase-like protein (DUF2156 family)
MASGTYRIHFDATLDELVDANLRLRTRSRSAQGYRTRSVWVAGGALCVALLAVVFIRARAALLDVSVAIWGVLVVVALERNPFTRAKEASASSISSSWLNRPLSMAGHGM